MRPFIDATEFHRNPRNPANGYRLFKRKDLERFLKKLERPER